MHGNLVFHRIILINTLTVNPKTPQLVVFHISNSAPYKGVLYSIEHTCTIQCSDLKALTFAEFQIVQGAKNKKWSYVDIPPRRINPPQLRAGQNLQPRAS